MEIVFNEIRIDGENQVVQQIPLWYSHRRFLPEDKIFKSGDVNVNIIVGSIINIIFVRILLIRG